MVWWVLCCHTVGCDVLVFEGGGVLRSEGLGEHIDAAHKGGNWIDFVGVWVVVITVCVWGAVILSSVVCVVVFVGVAGAGIVAVFFINPK